MFPLDDEGYYAADISSHYIETWRAMEKLVDEGLVRYIGLSNFNRTQGLKLIKFIFAYNHSTFLSAMFINNVFNTI